MRILGEDLNLKFVRENLSLIILFPTIVGGIWQILELWSVGISYIRFFSVSQIVPDGLLVLSFTVYVLANIQFYLLSESLGRLSKENQDKEAIAKGTYKAPTVGKKYRNFIVMLGVAAFCIIVIVVPEVRRLIETKNITSIRYALLATGVVFTVKSIYNAGRILFQIDDWTISAKNNWVFYPALTIALALFIAAVAGFFFFLRVFHLSFTRPADIRNFKEMHIQVKRISPASISHDILYFNDKYVFVQTVDTAKHKEIIVFNFEKLIAE